MITAGCDIGSRTAKAVILEGDTIIASEVIHARLDPRESAQTVFKLALQKAALSMEDIHAVVGTGYGQKEIQFADKLESEIVCHAKGAWWIHPSAKMVIDIGGQDSKVIKMDHAGKVIRYSYNDKCAAGTGRFLEIMADALGVDLEEMGSRSADSTENISISSQCVIFAETEVVSLVNEGKAINDILNALHRAMANRVASQARSLVVAEDVIMTGGVAKNAGVFDALSEGINLRMKSLETVDPQINGALGAALIARDL
ncbi:MAG: acyl-CoA dehydratase activase [Thermodesulfobacteriota bacterium]